MSVPLDDAQALLSEMIASVPAGERLLNHLADMLFITDEVLELLRSDAGSEFRCLEPRFQHVLADVNELMERLAN